MGLTFVSSYEIIMEISCSLEQVRHAIASNLRSPGVANLPYGAAVGLIEKNQFSLHFQKPGRNFWRPEFKGSFSATNNHVRIFVWCGLSKEAEAATALLWSLMGLGFIFGLGKLITARTNLYDFFGVCVTVVGSFALPWSAFWNEFQYDRIKMKSILDGIEREGNEATIGRVEGVEGVTPR